MSTNTSHAAKNLKEKTVRSVARQSPLYFFIIVLVSAIPAFLEGFDTNLYSFGSPYIVQNVHGSSALLGEVGTGFALGIAIFSMVGGYLFDQFSVKYTVMGSVIIFAVFTVVTGFVTSPVELLLARLLVGVGIGIFQPAIIALLGDIFFETRGRAVSAFAVFFGGGLFVGPYLITPFLPHYQIPFIISGIASAVALVIFYGVIPKTYKKIEKRRIGFSGIFHRNVVILSLSIFLFGIALFGYLGYYSDYLLKGLNLAPSQAAEVASMGGLGGLICAFPLGYLADRFGRKYLVSAAAFLIMIGSLGMFLVAKQIGLLTVLTFSFGAGWGIYVDLVATMAQDSVDDAIAGTVTGWIFLVFNIGALLGGPLFALLLPHGFVVAGVVTLGLSSTVSLILTLFTKRIDQSNILSIE
ncbi:Predicted arabinose efflux permease, MFS family [Sulfobacillus thermosulfidooxidans DSM 9293]|uniref:Predicted arabinose efflux permease, MFS family n=2 Tax=Sulfobacillus thermosulfidooxidans TaxID=28034 RepID=A0A1W1WL15_SULTA|nr:MFS transporter [Sulfobacillus thermosulfidooxidans]PSR29516.1 MAG: MFS transporter [Sulfobacillus thermosulfidooxidans]SMC06710.1 Predicted arabinose efflux permease, MFS family [Sulfobacillus thermosulfidooxidans DSM 9293]